MLVRATSDDAARERIDETVCESGSAAAAAGRRIAVVRDRGGPGLATVRAGDGRFDELTRRVGATSLLGRIRLRSTMPSPRRA